MVGAEVVEEARAGQHVAHVAEDAHEVEVDAPSARSRLAASAGAARRWSCPSGWSPRGRARRRAGGRARATSVSMRCTTAVRVGPEERAVRAQHGDAAVGAARRVVRDRPPGRLLARRPGPSRRSRPASSGRPARAATAPMATQQPVERAEHEHADERHDGGEEVVAAHRGVAAEGGDADQPPHGVDDDRREHGARQVGEQPGGEQRRSRGRRARPRPRSSACRRRRGRWRRSSTASRRPPSRRTGRRRGRRRRGRRTPGCRCPVSTAPLGAKVRTAARPSAMPTAAMARPPVMMPLHSETSTIGMDGIGMPVGTSPTTRTPLAARSSWARRRCRRRAR